MFAHGMSIPIAMACCAGIFTACSRSHPSAPRAHILQFDTKGRLLDPRTFKPLIRASRDAYLSDILKEIEKAFPDKQTRNVMLYAHGGLNTTNGSIRDATCRTEAMKGMKNPKIYPIFIVWRSSLLNSYWAHLYSDRQGVEYPATHPYAWGFFPFYLLVDVSRGVTRAPQVWAYTFSTGAFARDLKSRSPWGRRERDQRKALNVQAGVKEPEPENALEVFLRRVWFLATVPIKMITAPFVDAGGVGSWEAMLRRSTMPFVRQGDGKDSEVEDGSPPPTVLPGDLSQFMELLKERVAREGPENWNISLVGHSAGTIMMNNLIALHSDLPRTGSPPDASSGHATRRDAVMPYHEIDYLGSACPIRQWAGVVVPYLRRNPKARFMSAMLHPENEIDEEYACGLAPRGSLLVWIDDFLANPSTQFDFCLGRYDAYRDAVFDAGVVPEDLINKDRIRHLLFKRGKTAQCQGDPQGHGQIDDWYFDRYLPHPDDWEGKRAVQFKSLLQERRSPRKSE